MSLKGNMMTTTDVMKYLKPGAIVPVDVQTTALLVNALREALANEALDKKAENARELGLDYEPSAGTQVSKVWWDGERLMAKPIPLDDFYEPAQQEPVAIDWGAVHEKLCEVWQREISADEGLDEIQDLVVAATPPPQRQPLTVDEVWQNDQLMSLNAELGCTLDLLMEVARAIEAAHGIKENT
jgi:hypothetical protein